MLWYAISARKESINIWFMLLNTLTLIQMETWFHILRTCLLDPDWINPGEAQSSHRATVRQEHCLHSQLRISDYKLGFKETNYKRSDLPLSQMCCCTCLLCWSGLRSPRCWRQWAWGARCSPAVRKCWIWEWLLAGCAGWAPPQIWCWTTCPSEWTYPDPSHLDRENVSRYWDPADLGPMLSHRLLCTSDDFNQWSQVSSRLHSHEHLYHFSLHSPNPDHTESGAFDQETQK